VVKHAAAGPKPQVQGTKQGRQRAKSEVQSPKPVVHGPKAKVRSHQSSGATRPSSYSVSDIERRLRQLETEHDSARQAMDFNRVRELADERKYLEAELQARKADQVEGGGV